MNIISTQTRPGRATHHPTRNSRANDLPSDSVAKQRDQVVKDSRDSESQRKDWKSKLRIQQGLRGLSGAGMLAGVAAFGVGAFTGNVALQWASPLILGAGAVGIKVTTEAIKESRYQLSQMPSAASSEPVPQTSGETLGVFEGLEGPGNFTAG